MDEVSEKEEKLENEKNTEDEEKDEGTVPEEEVEEKPKMKEKKSSKKLILILAVILVLVGGGFAAKMFLTKTEVITETIKLSDDARGFSNYFKEYLLDRIKTEELFSYSYKDLSNDEILTKLTELKDGFSRVSRGVTGAYRSGDYGELAEVLEGDSSVMLTAVRELRGIMTNTYEDEEKRKEDFSDKVEATKKELRSALYLARGAFRDEVAGFSSKSVLIFRGNYLVEVGGGVMNILIGDLDKKVVAVSSDDLGEEIKMIDAKKLFGYTSARLVKLGEGLNKMMSEGWVLDIDGEVGTADVKVTKTKVSLVMKNVKGLNEELEQMGIRGLLEENEMGLKDGLEKARLSLGSGK